MRSGRGRGKGVVVRREERERWPWCEEGGGGGLLKEMGVWSIYRAVEKLLEEV